MSWWNSVRFPTGMIARPLLIVAIAVVITSAITDRRYAAKGTGESSGLVVSWQN